MSNSPNTKKSKGSIILLACALFAAAIFLLLFDNGGDTKKEQTYTVVINEVMSSNSEYSPHISGEYTDWVELYNFGDTAVTLKDCYITDNETQPYRYSLDKITIEPHSYKTIYLSSVVSDSDDFPTAPFGLSSKGEELILLTKTGTEIDRVNIPALRENISYGRNEAGEFVYWLSPSFSSPNSGSYASSANELAYTLCTVQISEYMLKNSMGIRDRDNEYSNWIELYNFGDKEISLGGFSLTNKPSQPKLWVFPEGTCIAAKERLIIYCSGKNTSENGELHTSFTLGRNSDYLALWTNENALAQEITLSYGGENISTCLDPFGQYRFSTVSTPNAENIISEGTTPKLDSGVIINEVCTVSGDTTDITADFIELYNYSDSSVSLLGYTLGNDIGVPFFTFPDISIGADSYIVVYCDGKNAADPKKPLHADTKLSSGGESIYLTDPSGSVCDFFETGKQRVSVSSGRQNGDSSVRLFFTTPTPGKKNSTGYAGFTKQPAALIHGGFVSKGTKVSLTADENAYITYTTNGSEPTAKSQKYDSAITISKNTVLRFAAFSDGMISSDIVTETYFVAGKHTIPVVSLSGNPKKISAKDTGLMYDSSIRDEYKCHVEYFDENGIKAVQFDAGVALFGYSSREYYQKGLRLRLREVYGENEVDYPFFGENSVDRFSSLLLRPGGEDQISAKIRDDFIPLVIRGMMDLDYQESQPAALYVNGKYWGLYFVRERLDSSYTKYKYGYDKDSVDIIKGNRQVVTGSSAQYKALVNYIDSHDMSKDSEYAYAAQQIDIDSLINFWIVETYFCNPDIGNIKCFRVRDTGKWRWMLYDMDWAMWHSTWDSNLIESKLLTTKYLPEIQNNKIMRNLLKNKQFRDRFITLYCYHVENTFNTDRTTAILNELIDYVQPELTRQQKELEYTSQKNLEKHWKNIRKFLSIKPEMAYEQLMSAFDLTSAELEAYKTAAKNLSL